MVKTSQLKAILQRLYEKYNHRKLIKPDPLQFVYNYHTKDDCQVAALLASSLAYGRVGQIEKSLRDLFGRMGASPFEFVLTLDAEKRRRLKDFKHRFATGDDISALMSSLQRELKKFGSIEKLFLDGYSSKDENIVPALSKFCDRLSNDGKLKHLLANPAAGSACKRLNLFLRWMVRDDDVDTGLWKSIDKTKLIVPVDVHMARLCKILGLYQRNDVSIKTAIEITENFKKIEPNDPVKYDFALSRIGIVEGCDGNYRPDCEDCQLLGFCKK